MSRGAAVTFPDRQEQYFSEGGQVIKELSVCIALQWAGTLCLASSLNSEEPKKTFSFTMAGMRKERLALRNGVCRINGQYTCRGFSNPSANMEGTIEIFLAFDQDKVRFDIKRPGLIVDESTLESDPKNPGLALFKSKKGTVEQKYCKNSKKTAFWTVGQQEIAIWANTGSPPPNALGFFDVRALGLYHCLALERQENFGKLIEGWESAKTLSDVDRSDSQLWVILWTMQDEAMMGEWRIWVDVQHGFTPVRFEVRERPPSGSGPWWVVQKSKTKWTGVDGVWVPVHHEFSVTPQPLPGKSAWRRDTSFDIVWEKVNNQIDPALFDYNSFDAPSTVGVVDSSGGRSIVIKQYQVPPPAGSAPTPFRMSALLVINLVIITLLLATFLLWYYRRLRRLKRKSD
jgi:hypothetical protein